MKDRLPFFINNSNAFREYKVETQEVEKKYVGSKEMYKSTVTTFEGIADSKNFEIFSIHTDRMPFWDAKQTKILEQITEPLSDFKNYRWNEIQQPIADYWLDKQELSKRRQKKQGIQTIWTPAGNYALWTFGALITFILIAKYTLLDDDRLLDKLEIKLKGFEADFTKLVLEPIKTFSSIQQIRKSESDQKIIAEKIVETITCSGRNRSGSFQDILDPDFRIDIRFLDSDEERELNSLFTLYDEVKREIESNNKLNEINQKLQVLEFWETPQGKRLNSLNSRRSHGGGLNFEEKEKLKRERVIEIVGDLEEVLRSWDIEEKYVKHGLQHFQDLYEKEVYERSKKDKSFKQMLEKSRSKYEDEKAILSGIWDDTSLNFIGILVGIAIGFGLSFASFVNSYKFLWGVGATLVSFIAFTLLFKWNFTKKPLLKLSIWVLKDHKSK